MSSSYIHLLNSVHHPADEPLPMPESVPKRKTCQKKKIKAMVVKKYKTFAVVMMIVPIDKLKDLKL